MANEITLAPRLRWLREALAPVLRKLEAALAEPRLPTAPVYSMRDAVTEGQNAINVSRVRLKDAVNGLMNSVFEREEVSDRDVYQAVWRFEVVLDVLIERYLKICRYCAKGSRDEEASALLMGMFRHSMREVRDWLQELLDTLTNPRAALLRKGLPTTGRVRITLTLALRTAPEAERLQQWMEEGTKPCLVTPAPAPIPVSSPAWRDVPAYLAYPPRPRLMPAQRRGVDFFDLILASTIGWGIGNALFGDD